MDEPPPPLTPLESLGCLGMAIGSAVLSLAVLGGVALGLYRLVLLIWPEP